FTGAKRPTAKEEGSQAARGIPNIHSRDTAHSRAGQTANPIGANGQRPILIAGLSRVHPKERVQQIPARPRILPRLAVDPIVELGRTKAVAGLQLEPLVDVLSQAISSRRQQV